MRQLRSWTYAAFAALLLTLAALSGSAQAFLDDPAAYDVAIATLRSQLGPHARVLKIEIARDGVSIEAQDTSNRNHVDRWRYGTVVYLKSIPIKRLTGPEPIDPTLINPDLEANLFDLDSVDLAATQKLTWIGRFRAISPAMRWPEPRCRRRRSRGWRSRNRSSSRAGLCSPGLSRFSSPRAKARKSSRI